jgi:streptomycin 6-kinase
VTPRDDLPDNEGALDAPLGELLGEGAEATIHVVDDARVVRVAKVGRSLRPEADVMRFVREAGYPAPRVHGISGDGHRLLLQRVTGPSLLDALISGEVTGSAGGELLGELHQRLHRIDAPPWLLSAERGTAVLHLDLHPANVLLGPDGPVVIDWPNAAAGPAGLDVADAYLVMASFPVPPGDLAALKADLLAAFLAAAGDVEPAAWAATAIERRRRDPHFSADQVALMDDAAAQL